MIIWTGVYDNFRETGITTAGFVGDIWYNKQIEKVKSCITSNTDINSLNTSEEYPLEIATAMLLSLHKKVRILDFGGGMGEYYFRTVSKIPRRQEDIFFDIVEGNRTIAFLPQELKDYKNLRFFEEIPKDNAYSLVHFGSVMQYIEKWKELLADVINLTKTEYLIFSDMVSGNIPTFVTTQKYYEQKIPVQFYNFEEFNSFLESLGFSLCYKSYFDAQILGKSFPDLCELPDSHKLDQTMNLIYKRI